MMVRHNMQLTDLLSRIIHCNSISSINPSIDQGNREVIDLLANTSGGAWLCYRNYGSGQ